jgi:hypothetical protein
VVGGIVFPGRGLISVTGDVIDWAKNLKNSVTGSTGASAREGKAAARLYEILNGTGENIPLLIRRLEEFSPSGATPTSAQKTGSMTLSAMETSLARTNAEFSGQTVQQGEDTFAAYKLLIQKLREVGAAGGDDLYGSKALRKAAEIEQKIHIDMLNGRLAAADATAAKKIAKISKDTPAARRRNWRHRKD